jgi:TonB family protein
MCHVRRRDNLGTAIHMVVEAVFWFHPLVWFLGAHLMEERERACDEEVLRAGHEPYAYAEGVLKICELYLQSPLRCMSGVTGSNLNTRIQAILAARIGSDLSSSRKTALAAAGILALAMPVAVGIIHAAPVESYKPTRVQSQNPPGYVVIQTFPAIQPVSKVDPTYPPFAFQARIQGIVVMTASIDSEGKVQNLEVIDGHPLLVQAAIDAVRRWVYPPQATTTTVTVSFSLSR